MDRITELERKHSVSLQFLELLFELLGSESILIQPVFPGNLSKNLYVASDQPGTAFHDHLDVWMVGVGCTELSGTPLLLPVWVELWIPEDSLGLSLVAQCYRLVTIQPGLVLCRHRQHYGYGLVGGSLAIFQQTVEVLGL